jgi:hypothetical protein
MNDQSETYMIDLYYWPTPNGHKITMFLEEAGLDYRICPGRHQCGGSIQAGVFGVFAQQPHADRLSRNKARVLKGARPEFCALKL